MLFLTMTCNYFHDYMQIKTLMWLQKTSADGDEKLIIKFMWPNRSFYQHHSLNDLITHRCLHPLNI